MDIALNDIIHQIFRTHTFGSGGFLNFQAMFIGTCKKKNLFPEQTLITGDNIRRNRGIGVTNMGNIINVVNWRCNVTNFAILRSTHDV